ncbi:M48 family metalloprotease [Actinoplanes sp. NPDC049265]|uniref:M48 family metalloprotease n=1 Tax=Actinoplanes sp. NPDC049265 TaxID=3363902 RepID=UPI0037152FE8
MNAAGTRRPNVLAYPSPTGGRLLLLVLGMLSAGTLAGRVIYAFVLYPRQMAPLCATGSGAPACRSAYLGLYAFEAGGGLLVAVAAVIAVLVTPAVIVRRRRLAAPGATLAPVVARIAELAEGEGLRRPPAVMIGPVAQRDAFSFGRPGHYVVALPKALAVRWADQSVFDPVVRHELAHIRHHDIPLTWLALSAGRAARPVFVVLAALFSAVQLWQPGEVSAGLLWRTALLWLLVILLRNHAVRAREHDADLAADRSGGDAIAGVIARIRTSPVRWWRRLSVLHPTPDRRLAVLADPVRGPRPTVLDGFAGAYLGALLFAVVDPAVQLLPVGGDPRLLLPVEVVPLGVAVGFAVGLGLWRTALVDTVTGRFRTPAAVAAGVAAGLVLGDFASYNWSARSVEAPLGPLLAYVVLLGAGGVVLSAALGQVWADAAPALPAGARSWRAAVVINGAVFGYLVLRPRWMRSVAGPAASPERVLVLLSEAWHFTLAMLVVVGATTVWALAARGRPRDSPGWLVTGPAGAWPRISRPGLPAVLVAGVLGGAAGAGVFLGIGPLFVPAGQASIVSWWSAVAAAVAVWLVCAVVLPRAGVAVGLLGGTVAVLTHDVATGVYLAAYGALTVPLPDYVLSIVPLTLPAFVEVALLLAPVALLRWPAPRRDLSGHLLVWPATLLAGATAAALLLAARSW